MMSPPASTARFFEPFDTLDAYEKGSISRVQTASVAPPKRRWRPLDKIATQGGALADRLILRSMEALFLSGGKPDLSGRIREKIDWGLELYGTPELLAAPSRFFRPVEEVPSFRQRPLSALKSGQRQRLAWKSTYRTFDPEYQSDYDAYTGNEINRVHVWRHNASGRPTVICIHGWCGGVLPVEERLFGASELYKSGFNVVLFTMPFHGGRTPRQAKFSGQLFPNSNARLANEAFGQAVADLRVLLGWLRTTLQSTEIGMMGISLGGYTSALMASLEPSLSFVIPVVAPCSFADILWHHGQGRPERKKVEAAGLTRWDLRGLWAVHCPLTYTLQVPHDRVLMIWGEGDRIVPSAHQLTLWEHWGQPRIESFPGGHLLQFGWSGYRALVRNWLKSKL